ncbi:MAG: nucleoside hydrolase [Bacteroidales bacterium]|nr:nucleoside hydrolase [Bacteroidales bacterium]
MLKKLFGFLLLAGVLCSQASGHSGKPKFQLIIDTDGALDDMRAISMFLSANDIRVLAITCSQGTLLPDSVYIKVHALLSVFHHEGIPVGISDGLAAESPAWRSFAENIRWANSASIPDPSRKESSMDILENTMGYSREKITLIALGSLKTYADWLKANPHDREKIERIIWYNTPRMKDGYNYSIDPESFEYIRQSGIPLEVVSGKRNDLLVNDNYLKHLQSLPSVYADQIVAVHSKAPVEERIRNKHLKLWDDLVPLYLTTPVMFETRVENNIRFATINQTLPPEFVYETIASLLMSAAYTNNRVFSAFPLDSTLYKTEYASILHETLRKYGMKEWKAISMTNEIHGHTGIYSIIGAKMGIRAMEYYNVGVNNLTVTTFTGNNPPISCFNDGIQISSGATIGQGLITVSDSVSSIPSAIFRFNERKVHISVKPEIAEQMRNEINYGVETFGLLTETYWLYIEKLAIIYWAGFDRNDIFVIENL